jgi:hypothetical protein
VLWRNKQYAPSQMAVVTEQAAQVEALVVEAPVEAVRAEGEEVEAVEEAVVVGAERVATLNHLLAQAEAERAEAALVAVHRTATIPGPKDLARLRIPKEHQCRCFQIRRRPVPRRALTELCST